jgi:hypothetical protein
MQQERALERGTNWQGVTLAAVVPLLVAAGLVYAAWQEQWEDSGDWALGLLALIPLEFVRALVMTILGDTFSRYQSPAQAVHYYLLSLAILAGILLVLAGYVLGFRDFIAAMTAWHTWRIILPVAALILVDGVITVYFFTGDAACQGARLQAAADDAGDLMGLALFPTPLVIAAGYAILLGLKHNEHAFASWVPEFSTDGLRSAALLYAAAYFVAKAVIVAHVNTAHFHATGHRLLGGAWVPVLQGRKAEQRLRDRQDEIRNIEQRRRALGLDAA